MPGFVFHAGAIMTCPQAGPATIEPSQSRVLVSGRPVATAADRIVVAGCTLQPPATCVTVRWINVATRVLAGGAPALLQAEPAGPGDGTCLPSGAPPIVQTMQPRVTGT